MNTTKDILFCTWQERKRQAFQPWVRLATDDLTLLDGKAQEVDVLFRRYRDNSFGPVKTRPNNKLSKNDHK
jgi:hypothetical protein